MYSFNGSLVRSVCILAVLALASCQKKRSSGPPNVLFIICDDLNDAIHGMGGHPQALTPSLDRLAKEGVRFTNAQCNAPLCGPSRASLWSGLFPHTTGYFGYNQQANRWRNNQTLRNTVTLFEHFAGNGYQVYATGKIHHNGHEDKSIFINEDGRDGFRVAASFGPYPWDDRPETATMQARGVMHPDMPENFRDNRWTEGFGEVRNISEAFGGHGSWLYDHRGNEYLIESAENRDLMPDEACTAYAVSVLQENHSRPFFLAIGYNRPHSPQYVPESYFDLYGIDTLIRSPFLENDRADCAPGTMNAHDVQGVNVGSSKYRNYYRSGGTGMIKLWTRAYLASVSFVDDQIGQVMHALRQSPYAENTLVIVTSDHGYHMGEKELIFKNTLWEESARIPFIVFGPDVAEGKECPRPVSLVDVYPSLLEYCGLPGSPNREGNGKELDGTSICELFRNPEEPDWDGPGVAITAVCSQEKLEVDQPGLPDHQHYSLRSERFRYIRYRNGEEELYDHRYDPYEWFNLARDPSYADMVNRYQHELNKVIR